MTRLETLRNQAIAKIGTGFFGFAATETTKGTITAYAERTHRRGREYYKVGWRLNGSTISKKTAAEMIGI